MSNMSDWEAIRREYEAGGVSFQQLAEKYKPSKSAIHRRAQKEMWDGMGRDAENVGRDGTEQEEVRNLHILRSVLPSPPNAVEGANLGLEALVNYLKDHKATMDLADHVKAATALSQYNKIIINAPLEAEEEEQKDFSEFSEEELRQYAEYEERARKRA